jgi:hypothetical protein
MVYSRAERGLWPPRSPDFFLWGFLNERVYSNNPRSSEELKHNTEQLLPTLTQKIFTKSRETLKSVDAYLREGGEHFQHLL